eukprot:m.154460 g.154460  ORF g.154460 m.154460 type:complete len:427 (-) comp20789_c0_seq1:2231-3511(-)
MFFSFLHLILFFSSSSFSLCLICMQQSGTRKKQNTNNTKHTQQTSILREERGHLAAVYSERRRRSLGSRQVGNVLPRVAVEPLLQAALVNVVAEETGGTTQHKQPVQAANFHILVGLLKSESARLSQQVHKGHCNGAVHVQDQVGLLLGGDLLDLQRVVEQRCLGKVLLHVVLDDNHAHIRVLQRLDAVTNSHDELALFLLVVDKVAGGHATVVSFGKHACCSIQSTAKAITNGEQPGAERRHQIFSRARSHNGVVRARHGWPVVGCDHQAHFDEFAGIGRQAALEPEQADDASDSNVVLENIRDGHAAVVQLVAALVGDARDKVCRLANQPKLLRPLKVNGHTRGRRLRLGDDGAIHHQLVIRLFDDVAQRVEALGNDCAGLLQGRVLGHGSFLFAIGARSSMPKLNLRGEHAGAGADAPGNHRL